MTSKTTKAVWLVLLGLTVACSPPAEKTPDAKEKASREGDTKEAKETPKKEAPKKEEPKKEEAKKPPAAPGLEGLTATVNGKPLHLQTAVAYSQGSSAVTLEFSTAKPKCDDFGGNGRMLAQGEEHFSVTVASKLLKDGKREPGVVGLYYDSHTKTGDDLAKINLTQDDPAKGVKGELDFELVLKASEFLKKPERKLVVKGSFEAKGCGRFPPRKKIAARPQEKLTVKVAGVTFPIQGAILQPSTFPSKGYDLTLNSSPVSCDQSSSSEDLLVKLHFAKGKPVNYVYMRGAVLSTQFNASLSDKDPSIGIGAKGKLEGDGEVALTLKGAVDVLGYNVSTDGAVSALRCPAK